MHKISQLLLCCLLPLTLASCGEALTGGQRLTVSIEPLRYFVENVAGDKFVVTTLVPTGASPETYELTPQQVVEVSDSRAYFTVGTLGLEKTRLQKLTENAPELVTVNVSDSIPLMTTDETNCTDEHHGHLHSDGVDLHTWTSTTSARAIVKRICHALIELDSANAAFYAHRSDSLLAHIDSIDVQIRATLRNLQHRTFLIYHPALGYFARDYGLQQMSVETDGKEPSAERMQQLIHRAQSENVKVVFIQTEHSGRAARRIAEAIGGRVVNISPLDYQWDAQMLHIAKSLVQ